MHLATMCGLDLGFLSYKHIDIGCYNMRNYRLLIYGNIGCSTFMIYPIVFSVKFSGNIFLCTLKISVGSAACKGKVLMLV